MQPTHAAREWRWGLAASVVSLALAWLIVQLSTIRLDFRPVPFLVVVVTGVGVMVRERVSRGTGLSPLMMALSAYVLIFGLVPLADLALGHPLIHNRSWWVASWLGWAGLLCMYGGYLFGRKLLPPTARKQQIFIWRRQVSILLSGLLLAIAAMAIIPRLQGIGGLGAFVARFGTERDVLSLDVQALFGVSMATTGLLLQAGSWVSRPTAARSLALFGGWFPVTLLLSYHGARWRAFAILLALLGIYHLGIRRLKWPMFGLLAAAAVVLFVLAGGFRGGGAIRPIFDPVFQRQYVASSEIGQFRDFVVTIGGVPERIPFQKGTTILSLIPGAPFPTGGAVFTSTFYPQSWAAGTSFPTPLPGELYMNFGIAGIVGGMVLFGAGLGLLESYRARRRGSPGTLVLYAYSLLPAFGIVRGDLTTFLGFWLVTVIPLVVALRIVERTRPAPSLSPGPAISVPDDSSSKRAGLPGTTPRR